MRGRFSLAILEARGAFVLASALVLSLALSSRPAQAEATVTIEIPDHPGEAAADTSEDGGEEEAAAVPEDLYLADALAKQLSSPALLNGQHADDVAALTDFYETRNGLALWLNSVGFSSGGEAVLGAIATADEWGLDPVLFPVPPMEYRPSSAEDRAATEIAISLAALKYARAARGGLADPKDLSRVYSVSPTIQPPEDVLKELSTAPAPDKVLLELHPSHEQFTRLRSALRKAQSEQDDMRIRRNMDRWRWMPEELGPSYVWLNIPEFMLEVVVDGKTVEEEKVIVGAKNTPTPVLSAEMTEIVFNPERVVPGSVIRRDVLPKLQGAGSFFGGNANTAILDQYGITVKRGGKAVDPKTIDWRKVNLSTLTFVQKPGRTNIMGKVQFLYPNDRKVFMRDTTLRGKFARDKRADGAQDPRVENASKLAGEVLSASNGSSSANVRQQIASGKTSRVKLTKPIPVHMTYFTAVVDDAGTVQSFEDIYALDGLSAQKASSGEAAPASSSTATPLPARKPIKGSFATTVP